MAYSATSPLALRFCEEYLIDLNGAAAAERAGYSARRAKQVASELLKLSAIQARIQQLQAERSERKRIEADDVLEELWAIAVADPRELIEYRHTCCRHCYGTDHNWQRTERELAAAKTAWENRLKKKPGDAFQLTGGDGGVGWDPRRAPHPECPECFGEGIQRVHVNDTRHLSRRAARLYAGVKTTKEGIEVKIHDQQAALVNVGKHLGMFVDKLEVKNFTLEDILRAAADADETASDDAGDA